MFRKLLAASLLTAACGAIHADMAIDVNQEKQQYTVMDGGRPVLTYNFGKMPVPEGVVGKYAVARSNYIHPLYGPGGEILTLDFSKDHPHHRGIYWAWPEVTYKGETRDLHALQGVFARPQGAPVTEAGADNARLTAVNIWKWGDSEPIVRETATIRVGLELQGIRAIDFEFHFEALVPGVSIARRGRHKYGGFNVRMSPRKDLKISKHTSDVGFPYHTAYAEAVGIPPKGTEPVGLFLLQSPLNPEYPGEWVDYPVLPWLQPTFPTAGTAYQLSQEKPLVLRYRILIRHGKGLAVAGDSLFDDYINNLPDPLAAEAGWKFGDDCRDLKKMEDSIRSLPLQDYATAEKRLLKLLADEKSSADFRRRICRQLVIVGSEKSVPAMTALLQDDFCWMQAADVLMSMPGDAGAAALRRELPSLKTEVQASVIHLLGVRRDKRSVELLTKYAAGSQMQVTAAAVGALGMIGTADAGEAILSLAPDKELGDILRDARLQAAEELRRIGQNRGLSEKLCRSVWNDSDSADWQKAAALKGLAAVGAEGAPQMIRTALAGSNLHLIHGAVAALSDLPESDLAVLADMGSIPDGTYPALLTVLGQRGIHAAEPKMIAALKHSDPAIQLSAVTALKGAGSAAAVNPLLVYIAEGGKFKKEAESVLAQMQGGDIGEILAGRAVGDDSRKAALATEILGIRQDTGYLDIMLDVLRHGDPKAQKKALIVLRNNGVPDQLSALRDIMLKAPVKQKSGIAKVITSICRRQPDAEKCLSGVLAGSSSFDSVSRSAMLAAVPAVGGRAALNFVLQNPDEEMVRALIKWPDSGAVDPLIDIMEDNDAAPKMKTIAAAGGVQYANRALSVSDQKRFLPHLLPGLDSAGRAEVKKYLNGLSLVNLALNKPAVGSKPVESGHVPQLAVDGDKSLNSYWGCTPPPASLTIDLEHVEHISRVHVITYWGDNRAYQYKIETSIDGEAWLPAADMSKNRKPAVEAGVMHTFQVRKARLVRVVMLNNSLNPGLHIVEVEVF